MCRPNITQCLFVKPLRACSPMAKCGKTKSRPSTPCRPKRSTGTIPSTCVRPSTPIRAKGSIQLVSNGWYSANPSSACALVWGHETPSLLGAASQFGVYRDAARCSEPAGSRSRSLPLATAGYAWWTIQRRFGSLRRGSSERNCRPLRTSPPVISVHRRDHSGRCQRLVERKLC